jgi:hypothetical protein
VIYVRAGDVHTALRAGSATSVLSPLGVVVAGPDRVLYQQCWSPVASIT